MNKKKTTNSKSLFTGFFYILITLIYLAKAESSLCAPIEHCHYSNPTEIELVVTTETEYDLSLFKLGASPKQDADFTGAHIDFIDI